MAGQLMRRRWEILILIVCVGFWLLDALWQWVWRKVLRSLDRWTGIY
jgi:hypothetical protein